MEVSKQFTARIESGESVLCVTCHCGSEECIELTTEYRRFDCDGCGQGYDVEPVVTWTVWTSDDGANTATVDYGHTEVSRGGW